MDVSQALADDLRLAILEILKDAGPANEIVLKQALAGVVKQTPSSDRLRAELERLADQGLIHLTHVVAVHITERGEDVAEGRATADGVRRPPG